MARVAAVIIRLKYTVALNLSVVSVENNRREMLKRELELMQCAAALQAAINAAKLEHETRPTFLELSELTRLSQAGVPESELAPLREYMADVPTADVIELMDYADASGRRELILQAALLAEFHHRFEFDRVANDLEPPPVSEHQTRRIEPLTGVAGSALVAVATPQGEPINYARLMDKNGEWVDVKVPKMIESLLEEVE